MRLTCPNCAAAYEVSDTLVPAGGRHVQCTACHTRWFEKPGPAVVPSEDQILRRLESRGARLVAVPSSPPPPLSEDAAPAADAPDAGPSDTGVTLAVVPEAEVAPEPEPDPAAEPATAAEADVPSSVEPAPAPEPDMPPPADRSPAASAPRRPPEPLSATSARPVRDDGVRDAPASGRPALRLDLTGMPADSAGLRTRSRFGRGLVVAAAIAALAAGVYLRAAPLAARVPPLEPALVAYVAFVDGLRADIAALRPEAPDPQD